MRFLCWRGGDTSRCGPLTGSATPKMVGPGVESRATALDGPGRQRAPRGEPLAWRGDAFGARARCRERSVTVCDRGGVIPCGMATPFVFGPGGLWALRGMA